MAHTVVDQGAGGEDKSGSEFVTRTELHKY